ncbi:MAG TPA: JAB domain-containing protein [Rhodothermales bacterium]|nr:JAB domain-containing protein [Rhodothermales bacterium]
MNEHSERIDHDRHGPERRHGQTLLAPIFHVRLVRERLLKTPKVSTPDDVAPIACRYLQDADREHFVVILLSVCNQIIGINTAHVGSLHASVVAAREVFKPAILANAARIIVAHNHPSGNVEPSREDIAVSKRLVEVGSLLEIPVLDSLIIGHEGRFTSLSQRGLLS